ncbi:hypothetical protein KA107_02865 [Candidatus Pacearchaeota archaeon]|nr:hypothetical protein [Candidatus Pacearchaeota archaeon]
MVRRLVKTKVTPAQAYGGYILKRQFDSTINGTLEVDLFYFSWQTRARKAEKLSASSKRDFRRYEKSERLAEVRSNPEFVGRTLDWAEKVLDNSSALSSLLNLCREDVEEYRQKYGLGIPPSSTSLPIPERLVYMEEFLKKIGHIN